MAVYDWPAILDEVADWLASGRTVRDYCRQEGKPTHELIYRHLAKEPEETRSRIARARAEGCDAIAEEALAIADECAEKPELATACKVRFDARLKLMSKWNSGRYGDRQQVEHSGKLSLEQLLADTAKQAPPAES